MRIEIDSGITRSGFKSVMLNCPKKDDYIYLGDTCEKCEYCVSIDCVHLECSYDWDESTVKVLTDEDGKKYAINQYKFKKFVKDCLMKED